MHEKLIQKVMTMLLSGEDEILELLRQQYDNAIIKSIESSSVGFFVNYEINSYVICNEAYICDFEIGDVYGSVNGVDAALGFILFVRNGIIVMLEGYTNIIDNWPDDDKISLYYDSGEHRNYDVLRKNWKF